MKTIQERLDEFFRRLDSSPRAGSAVETLEELGRTLDEVEDAWSGVPKQTPPPPPNMPDGRMYPPLRDNILHHPGGVITALTRGHIIEIGPDGAIVIRNKRTRAVEFRK
jgi:hypothetical protein